MQELATPVAERPVATHSIYRDGLLDVNALLRALLVQWKLVAASLVLGVLCAILYLHLATYRHTATLAVAPVQADQGALGGALGSLGRVAALGGVSLPADSSQLQFQMYVEGLTSRRVAGLLADDLSVTSRLFEVEWDVANQRFRDPGSSLRPVVTLAKVVLGVPMRPYAPPDAARVQETLRETLRISEDKDRPFVRVAFDHEDPEFAALLLARLHELTDGDLRARERARAEENIMFLSEQLQTVVLAEHRAALAESLSEQEKVRMSALSSAPFAAEPLEVPAASRKPTSPRTFMVLAIGVFGGLVLGLLVAMWRIHSAERSASMEPQEA